MDKKSNLNKFLTFLENDFYRSLKVMIPTMGLFFLAHIVATTLSIRDFNSFINNLAKKLQQDVNTLSGQEIGTYSILRMLNQSFVITISIISFLVIILYTLVLWNREWRGSSKTCYTLLTLPIKKHYILISKILTIFIFLGINLVVQCSSLFIDKLLINMMIPKNFIRDTSILNILNGVCNQEVQGIRHYILNCPFDMVTMVLDILLALSFIILLGLIVLLFRSFKLKGGVLGIIIFIAYITSYMLAPERLNLYFDEKVLFNTILPFIISVLGFIWSKHLLEKKVSV